MFRVLFLITVLLLFPRRVHGWVPEAQPPWREFGALLDNEEMLELRSHPDQWQVFLPTFNPLHRAHKMIAPFHSPVEKASAGRSLKPRNRLPGYSDPALMQDLQDSEALLVNNVLKLFYNKDHHLPDTVDIFGRDNDDVPTTLDDMKEDPENYHQPKTKQIESHTTRIYFEPRHKLPDGHYGSAL